MAFEELFLDPVVDGILVHLLGQAIGHIEQLGKKDPIRKALELAIGRAIKLYVTSNGNADLAGPLLQRRGFLSQLEVAAQFAEALRRGGAPDAELIGQRWQEALKQAPVGRNLTSEAEILLGYFREEADWIELLRSVKEVRALAVIQDDMRRLADTVDVGAAGLGELDEQLRAIRSELASIADLAAQLGGMTRGLKAGVRIHLYDQTALIDEKTRGFVGRNFVFNQVRGFIDDSSYGYCYVVAHPGVGKTSLAAQLVKTGRFVHHFNVRTANVSSPSTFLNNVCAQLVGAYHLPYDALPPQAAQDSAFLTELLAKSAEAVKGDKLVIVIDALDEADTTGMLPGTNPMYLPEFIPERCFFVITTRKDESGRPPRLRVNCEQFLVSINEHDDSNMNDIRAYIRRRATARGIQSYMRSHGLDEGAFAEHLAEKSDGNFMYLHHVLPQIERGTLRDRDLAELPLGLAQYYSDHLERMRGTDEQAWFQYKLPVIAALSLTRRPLTVSEVVALSGVDNAARVRDTLRDWGQFLDRVNAVRNGIRQKAYRIYHASFQDFLREQTEGVPSQEDLLLDKLAREARAWYGDDG